MPGTIIRVIVALMMLVGIVLLISKKTRYGGKAVISDAIGITAFFAVIEVFVSHIGWNAQGWILLAEAAAVILAAAIAICAIWGRLKAGAVWIPLVSAFVLCCAVSGVYHAC